MKKSALLMAVMAMTISVTSYGKKCDVCRNKNLFGNEEAESLNVCSDCMEEARAIGAEF